MKIIPGTGSVTLNRRNPPLAELRVFEAAARHLSFTRAATELGVTQGAISQRIRHLEDLLERRLFQRLTRAIALTPEGETLAAWVGAALTLIDEGLNDVLAPATPGDPTLTIHVAASFASRWLLPRLARFHACHPDIRLKIDSSAQVGNGREAEVDLSIRFGTGQYPGLTTSLLMREFIFPVCRSALIEGGTALQQPADLFTYVLLHDSTADVSGAGWRDWLGTIGLTLRPHKGLSFSDNHLAVDAAGEGLGVALGRASLVNDDLAAGRLVRPFRHAIESRHAHYLVYRARPAFNPALRAFIDWLYAEVDLSQAHYRAGDQPATLRAHLR